LLECDDKVAVCTGNGVSTWTLDGKIISNMTNPEVDNCCHVTAMQVNLHGKFEYLVIITLKFL